MTIPLDQQQPENRFSTPSYYEAVGLTPSVADAFFVQWFRSTFSSAANLLHPVLRNAGTQFVWSAQSAAGILIETTDVWIKRQEEHRPAILIKRNDWNWQRIGIGDLFMGGNTVDGHDRYGLMMIGSSTVICLSREAGEVSAIAEEVFQSILHSQAIIRESLCLNRFVLASMASIGKLKEATDTFAIPVTVAYAQEAVHTLRVESPILKRVVLK